ncbi:MAG: KGK domain-containing protein [Cyanobacteriota bacterium]|nr:KGK domain-containing protein [Cyanobacteriota bacterium]
MDNTFQALECDTDILMIGKDTFTVERFKELVVEKIQISFNECFIVHRANNNYNQNIHSYSMFSLLSRNIIKIVDKSVEFQLQNIELIFPPEGMECKVLKLGNSEWQAGKMRIHVMVAQNSVRVIKLEFCYDEPPQQESPLDDIRQRENYQQLLNNE